MPAALNLLLKLWDGAADFKFIDLQKTTSFVCRECGARVVQVMPDWPPYTGRYAASRFEESSGSN